MTELDEKVKVVLTDLQHLEYEVIEAFTAHDLYQIIARLDVLKALLLQQAAKMSQSNDGL